MFRTLKTKLAALRYPAQKEHDAVVAMTANQWEGIARRTPTYLAGYRDNPGSDDRAQRRARWVADRPIFAAASSVLELGCAAGRNLAELARRHTHLELTGADINAEALEIARATVPCATLYLNNLYDLGHDWVLDPVDVILTVGVLGHVAPLSLHWIHRQMLAAVPVLVLVEEVGDGALAKGPKAWGALKSTGAYTLWRSPLDRLLRILGAAVEVALLAEDLCAPGATHLVVARRGEPA